MAGWRFATRKGQFAIAPEGTRFVVLFCGLQLGGTYQTAELALIDLLRGPIAPDGIDPKELGVPADLSEWER
jgi:hypothetical protein